MDSLTAVSEIAAEFSIISSDTGIDNEFFQTDITYNSLSTIFELPVIGATGFAAIDLFLFSAPDKNASIAGELNAGQGFTILNEVKDFWYVSVNNLTGWVTSNLCMINIPDIIPSIVQDNTNTYSSLMRSSQIDIPNITGHALYNAKDFNLRLGREEYIAPVLYQMAAKIFDAQKTALANGHTIIIYESFRPHDAHQAVFENFEELINTNAAVRRGVSSGWLFSGWFLAPSPYNHQRGTAVDVSLGVILEKETVVAGGFQFTRVLKYSEFPMQSQMHELSADAVIFTTSIYSRDDIAWRSAVYLDTVTEGTRILHNYMTGSGLTPLASEWWHFNDIEATALATANDVLGKFQIEKSFSLPVK